ncbi:MAG: hypothetical protein WC497_01520 [Patescibacteria group bacterium]
MKKQIIILAIVAVVAILVFFWLTSIRKNLEKTAYHQIKAVAAVVEI